MKTKFRSPIMMLLCISLIFMGLLTVRSSVTYACSCVSTPVEPLEALERSSAVFVGKVVSIKEPKGKVISSADSVKVTFEVDSSWKGVEDDKVTLITALSSASCGFIFTEGESYLVYAGNEIDSGKLGVSMCSGTVLLSSAGDDLKELGPATFTGTAAESPESTKSVSPSSGAERDAGARNNGTSDPTSNAATNSGPFTLVNVGISGVIVVLIAIVAAVLYRRKK